MAEQSSTAGDSSFGLIKINSEPNDLWQFDENFSAQHIGRRECLINLRFEGVLPPVSAKRMKKLQSKSEAAANNAVFTKAILALFERLTNLEAANIKLVLSVASPTDSDRDSIARIRNKHAGDPIWEVRNHFKYVDFDHSLLPAAGIPFVRGISSIDLERELSVSGRRLHPHAISVLASALPNLKEVKCACMMPSRRLMPFRKEIRSALADALQNGPFNHLNTLGIYLEDSHPLNESFDPGNFCEKNEEDDLSLAVGRILQLPAITKINLNGSWILAPKAFGEVRTFGPALKSVKMEGSGVTPDGRWLSTGDEDEGDLDEDLPDTDSEASEAAFDSEDSDTSDFMPEHEWEKEAGNIPRFSWRTKFDDTVFSTHLASSRCFSPFVFSFSPSVQEPSSSKYNFS
ncbi:F-box domain cyclin-like [Colletotrichum tofieldiae]|nr:F-box domain cyclin-like [Colletotrichum tofieldiae]GKT71941.1 F-box domain cyclin-like [Colletotrichum tofieldiae]